LGKVENIFLTRPSLDLCFNNEKRCMVGLAWQAAFFQIVQRLMNVSIVAVYQRWFFSKWRKESEEIHQSCGSLSER